MIHSSSLLFHELRTTYLHTVFEKIAQLLNCPGLMIKTKKTKNKTKQNKQKEQKRE